MQLFYFQDLVRYVHELDRAKLHVLLVNKADFLSLRARVRWARYFRASHIRFVFFSANFDTLDSSQQHTLQHDLAFDVVQPMVTPA